MKLTYTKQGDYLIPYITIRQPRKALGHYGRLRKTYLQNFRPILFNELVFSEKSRPEHDKVLENYNWHHKFGSASHRGCMFYQGNDLA